MAIRKFLEEHKSEEEADLYRKAKHLIGVFFSICVTECVQITIDIIIKLLIETIRKITS
jgi:hypothetical protein